MDGKKRFEEAIKAGLIQGYIDGYGREAWESKSDREKAETLHNLLASLLTVARDRNK